MQLFQFPQFGCCLIVFKCFNSGPPRPRRPPWPPRHARGQGRARLPRREGSARRRPAGHARTARRPGRCGGEGEGRAARAPGSVRAQGRQGSARRAGKYMSCPTIFRLANVGFWSYYKGKELTIFSRHTRTKFSIQLSSLSMENFR